MQLPRLPSLLATAAAHFPGHPITSLTTKSSPWTRKALAQRMIVPGLTGALLCILTSAFGLGQVVGPARVPVVIPGPVPPAHLYYSFLMVVNHDDRAADQHKKQGKDGEWLHNLKQNELGFTDEEFAPIRATAQLLEAELKEIDAKKQAINDARQAAHPLPPELKALRQQHDDAVESEVTDLQRPLGPDAAARLDLYIQTHIHSGHPDSATAEERQTDSLRRYNLFLMMVNHNVRASAEGEQEGEGRNGTHPIINYQHLLGFTDEEFALVCAAAQRLDAKNKEISAAEKPTIDAYYAAIPTSPELITLSQQREATIEKEVSALQRVLGPDLSARLDEYIHAHLQSHEGTPDLDSERTRVFQMETSPSKK